MNPDIADNPFYLSTRFIGKKLHMSVTGSIAAYKAADLLRAFKKSGLSVSVTVSSGGRQFVTPLLFSALGAEKVYEDMFSCSTSPFAHLEPGQQADTMLLAPASANALANLANGNASDLYAAQALAFERPIIIAPAMNPKMWHNPATQANAQKLKERKYILIKPGTGATACGEEGEGRLAPLVEIFLALLKSLAPTDLRGLKVMVTMGPTREPWDGMRFLSNPSSGRMGAALATAAWLRGAEVFAICGPGLSVYLPQEIKKINVMTAREMFAAAEDIWPGMDWGLFCAAVGDFHPIRPAGADGIKIHKNEDVASIALGKNPDILAHLSTNRRKNQKTLGFAAEIVPVTGDLQPLARQKLIKKNADIIAANRINQGDGAFGSDVSEMLIMDREGQEEHWKPQSKADIAWELCSWLLRI